MYLHFRSKGYVIFNNMRGGLHFNNQFSLVLAQRAPGGRFTHVHSDLQGSAYIFQNL